MRSFNITSELFTCSTFQGKYQIHSFHFGRTKKVLFFAKWKNHYFESTLEPTKATLEHPPLKYLQCDFVTIMYLLSIKKHELANNTETITVNNNCLVIWS